jgi:hypothetical protein
VGRGAKARESGKVEDELKKRRFLWGVAWLGTVLPILIGLGHAFKTEGNWDRRGAGGTELFVVWGIAAMLIGQVAAIVLLSRAFSPGHWMRSLLSVLSICLSGLMLILWAFFCGSRGSRLTTASNQIFRAIVILF